MNRIKTYITLIITGLVSVCFVASAQEIKNYNTFTTDIVQASLSGTDTIDSTSDLVNIFCSTLYHNKQRYDDTTSYMYDATQSLFMMALCDGSGETSNKYFQHLKLSDYGLECNGSLLGDGDDCQVPLYRMIHNLYNRIISDMVDAMTAQAYGYNGRITKEEEENLDQISFAYLTSYGSARQGLCSDKNDCIIPETRETLKQYLSQARQLIQKRKWIVQTVPEKQELCEQKSRKNGSYNIINCGLSADAPILQQHNLISNELIRYTAFVQYYAYQLTHNPKIQPNITTSNIDKFIQQGTDQATELLHNHQSAVEATHQSIQQVAQIRATFPVHIHLMAYYEVIKEVRDQLARLYTPLHQLYYKLRNVQSQS
ncbi:MAG: hypothetical protein H6766_07265 [Candidatus Peribacteria bacterium]|nr:MAG: hypothetical protein H6766_07265 [Candidatus Peribacteria bacterium]